uniref:Uncharacterized protein n=1 Tax=Gasterosteus aculeatus TaxID=69293 RepID=G3Q076_GASAC
MLRSYMCFGHWSQWFVPLGALRLRCHTRAASRVATFLHFMIFLQGCPASVVLGGGILLSFFLWSSLPLTWLFPRDFRTCNCACPFLVVSLQKAMRFAGFLCTVSLLLFH